MKDDRIAGIVVMQDGTRKTLPADAIVLACGGFQGDRAMMREHFGPGADTMRFLSPGTRHNTGEGIRMALAIGADRSGDWNGMHAEPVDARAKNSAPVVLVYPYGIVVDRHGRRFFDEGAGLVHETWETFARDIHFKAPGSIAYADPRQPPARDRGLSARHSLRGAAVSRRHARRAGAGSSASTPTRSPPRSRPTTRRAPAIRTRSTRRAATGWPRSRALDPPKSNWARAVQAPPFLAYPLVGAVAYTFGGLATDADARVLRDGEPIPGLYAAGEITGHFYGPRPMPYRCCALWCLDG